MVQQTIWFLACWFFKHDIWTCCEKLWVNVIFAWIAAVFHSLLLFLTLISFARMDFQKFSSFFQVVGLSTFGDNKFLKIHRKIWFYMANHGKTLEFIMKFSKKKIAGKFKYYFIQFLQFLLFFSSSFWWKDVVNLVLQ